MFVAGRGGLEKWTQVLPLFLARAFANAARPATLPPQPAALFLFSFVPLLDTLRTHSLLLHTAH